MADLLGLSARLIDENISDGMQAIGRMSGELSEIAGDIAMVEAFSHVVAFRTGDGLVLFDTSLEGFADNVRKSLRGWSDEPVNTMAFTHGHIDHVGGAGIFLKEASERGDKRPRVVGHENVRPRFGRYEMTNGYNAIINARQFAPASEIGFQRLDAKGAVGRFGPSPFVEPDTVFRDRMELKVGDTRFELRHAKGETDDHLWAWIPEHKAICAGDFVIWVFPNAGNPQKVQRYPLEWARTLRDMIALEPELLLPAHGLPVSGRDRIAGMLDNMATALETIVEQSLRMMNEGARLDDIIHSVTLPGGLLDKPYLQPLYDEPEFIIHNVWRLYGGWYDGNPARLKPAPDRQLAAELAALAGGASKLAARARTLSEAGEHRLACHLAELAVQADPEAKDCHLARAEVYGERRKAESSLMAKGIFGWAERESAHIAGRNEGEA